MKKKNKKKTKKKKKKNSLVGDLYYQFSNVKFS